MSDIVEVSDNSDTISRFNQFELVSEALLYIQSKRRKIERLL